MAPTTGSSARFRQRKISVKQTLQVLWQSDVPDLEDEQQRELQHVETGVEKGEEEEHHLQAAINASIAAATSGTNVEQVYIPTPDASKIWKDFSKYYKKGFSSPHSYIRQSSTVEDLSGCPYNMDEEDEVFLKKLNKGKTPSNQCSEDDFEMIMHKFETVIDEKQPYLSMDPSEVLSFEELAPVITEQLKESENDVNNPELLLTKLSTAQTAPTTRKSKKPPSAHFKMFGALIYPHWKERKIQRHGRSIAPTLKTEDNNKDDSDPYVCFRRREVRQVRKTRRTDTQSSEKLRKLRMELQAAKYLMEMIVQRESMRSDALQLEIEIFTSRVKMKDLKRSLNITGDEEDLVTHKKRKTGQAVVKEESQESATELAKQASTTMPAKAKALVTSGLSGVQNVAATAVGASAAGSATGSAAAAAATSVLPPGAPTAAAAAAALAQQAQKQQLLQQQQLQAQQSQLQVKQSQAQAAALGQAHTVQNQIPQSYPIHHVPQQTRLPVSKIPDMDLVSLDKILSNKEAAMKASIKEKLRRRAIEDKTWLNYTDNPFVPYCDYFDPDETTRNALTIIQPNHAAYSSIATAYPPAPDKCLKFPLASSLGQGYSSRLETNPYLLQTKINEKGGMDIVNKINDREGPWPDEGHNIPRGTAISLRRRFGRGGRIIVDRRGIVRRPKSIDEIYNLDPQESGRITKELEEWSSLGTFSGSSVEDTRQRSETLARLERLDDRYKYDSDVHFDNTEYSGGDPSKLNGISEGTQAIRFGAMLISKAYDNFWEVFKNRQQQLGAMHKKLQKHQQAQQQAQQLAQQQQQQQQPQQQQQQRQPNQAQMAQPSVPAHLTQQHAASMHQAQQLLQQQIKQQMHNAAIKQQNAQQRLHPTQQQQRASYIPANVQRQINHAAALQQQQQQQNIPSPQIQMKAKLASQQQQQQYISRSQSPSSPMMNSVTIDSKGKVAQSIATPTTANANFRAQTQSPQLYHHQQQQQQQQQAAAIAAASRHSPQLTHAGVGSQRSSPSMAFNTLNQFSPHGTVPSSPSTTTVLPNGNGVVRGTGVQGSPVMASPTMSNAVRRVATPQQQAQQQQQLLGMATNGASVINNPALQAQLHLLSQKQQQQQRVVAGATTALQQQMRVATSQANGYPGNQNPAGTMASAAMAFTSDGATGNIVLASQGPQKQVQPQQQQMKSSPRLANMAATVSPTLTQQALYQQIKNAGAGQSPLTGPHAAVVGFSPNHTVMRQQQAPSPAQQQPQKQ